MEGDLSLPFPTNQRGATQTDPTLRVVGHQRVFALGDIAVSRSSGSVGASAGGDLSAAGEQLPATAQVCGGVFLGRSMWEQRTACQPASWAGTKSRPA